MIVDVTWDGVALARGAQARNEGDGWFVELEQPMPVGTLLSLTGEVDATVHVARVHEGLGAGMLVRKAGARAATTAAASPHVETEAEPEEKESGGGRKRRKTKRNIKTE